MRIRAGAGLGDSIYLRVIAEYFKAQGEDVTVCSDYPDVFIGAGVAIDKFGRQNIDRLCHYTVGKTNPNTTQFRDMLDSAGIKDSVDLCFEWKVQNEGLRYELETRSDGRPIILVHGGRLPMNRKDGFGRSIMPDERGFAVVFEHLVSKHNAFLVRIGRGPEEYDMAAYCHYDLNDRTTIPDLYDLANMCDGVVAQCSYAVPLAEVFDRPLLAVWARAGLHPGEHMYVRQITPAKILEKSTSRYVMDDWSEVTIQKVVDDFRA